MRNVKSLVGFFFFYFFMCYNTVVGVVVVVVVVVVGSPLYRGSWARSRAYCSAVMQVHCGSRPLLGLAGVDRGFLRAPLPAPTWPALPLPAFPEPPLPGGSSFSEYDDDALRLNLNVGDCKQKTRSISLLVQ